MNLPLFTQTNNKGQVVIPKSIRKKLDITQGTLLEIVVRAQGLYLYPVKTQRKNIAVHEPFLQLLKKTAGVWGNTTPNEEKRYQLQHQLEMVAAKRRQQSW